MKKIKNYQKINSTPLRNKALQILEAGLWSIDTKSVIKKEVSLKENLLTIQKETLDVDLYERIFVFGVGKCSFSAAQALEEILKDKITGGLVIDVKTGGKLKHIKGYRGTHPFPSEKNIRYTKKIIDGLSKATEKDLVIFIISGGGSTLLCQPTGFECSKEAKILKQLFKASAPIEEINTIRKHISYARGGQLAKAAYPAKVVSLIFSDVPSANNNLGFIASGPTTKDTTTAEDAKLVFEKYQIKKDECQIIETPKDSRYFEKVNNILIVSNETALLAMSETAKDLELRPEIKNACLSGEAKKQGKEILKKLDRQSLGTALLYGGETTVKINGSGKGGRNQELILSALEEIGPEEIIISVNSDGYDNTPFAGAIADTETLKHAQKKALKIKIFLENNDSFNFFKKTGDFIETGPTGSNVSDLILAIKH